MANESAKFRIAYVIDGMQEVRASVDQATNIVLKGKKDIEKQKVNIFNPQYVARTAKEFSNQIAKATSKSAHQKGTKFIDLTPTKKSLVDIDKESKRGLGSLKERLFAAAHGVKFLTKDLSGLRALLKPKSITSPTFLSKQQLDEERTSVNLLKKTYYDLRAVKVKMASGEESAAIMGRRRGTYGKDNEEKIIALKREGEALKTFDKGRMSPAAPKEVFDSKQVQIFDRTVATLNSHLGVTKSSLIDTRVQGELFASKMQQRFPMLGPIIAHPFKALKEGIAQARLPQGGLVDLILGPGGRTKEELQTVTGQIALLSKEASNLRRVGVKTKHGLIRGIVGDTKDTKNVLLAVEQLKKLAVLPKSKAPKGSIVDIKEANTIAQAFKVWKENLVGSERPIVRIAQGVKDIASRYPTSLAKTWKEGKIEAEAYNFAQKKIKTTLDALKRGPTDIFGKQSDMSKGRTLLKSLLKEYKKLATATNKMKKGSQKGFAIKGMTGQVEKTKALRQAIKNLSGELKRSGKLSITTTRDFNIYGQSLDEAIVRVFKYRIALNALMKTQQAMMQGYTTLIKLESKLAQIKIVLPDVSDLGQLKKEFFGLAETYGTGILQVADAFKIFAQQGLGVNQALELTKSSLLAMNVAGLTATQSTEALTAIMRNFLIPANEMGIAVDKLLAVQAKFAVTSQDLATSLMKAAPVARLFGDSLDFVLGATAGVVEISRRAGREVGTAFRTIFGRIGRPASVEALESVHVAVFKANGEFRTTQNILTDLATRWDHLTESEQRMIGETLAGLRRIQDFMALMQNFDRVLEATTISMLAFGQAGKANKDVMHTLEKQMTILNVKAAKLSEQTFKAGLEPIVRATAKGVGALTDALAGLPPAFIAVTGSVLTLLATFKLLKAFRLGEGAVIGGILQGLSASSMKKVMLKWKGLWKGLLVVSIGNTKAISKIVHKAFPIAAGAVSYLGTALTTLVPLLLGVGVALAVLLKVVSSAWKYFSRLGDSQDDVIRKSGEFAKSLEFALTPTQETVRVIKTLGREYGDFTKILSKAAKGKNVQELLDVDAKDMLKMVNLHRDVVGSMEKELDLMVKTRKELSETVSNWKELTELEKENLIHTTNLSKINRLISVSLSEYHNKMKLIRDQAERFSETMLVAVKAAINLEKHPIKKAISGVWRGLLSRETSDFGRFIEKFGIDSGSEYAEQFINAYNKRIKELKVIPVFPGAVQELEDYVDFVVTAMDRMFPGNLAPLKALGFKDAFKSLSQDIIPAAERFKLMSEVTSEIILDQAKHQFGVAKGIREIINSSEDLQGVLGSQADIALFVEKLVSETNLEYVLTTTLMKEHVKEMKRLETLWKSIQREPAMMTAALERIAKLLKGMVKKSVDLVYQFKKVSETAPQMAKIGEMFGDIDITPARKTFDAFRKLLEGMVGQTWDASVMLEKQVTIVGILDTAYSNVVKNMIITGKATHDGAVNAAKFTTSLEDADNVAKNIQGSMNTIAGLSAFNLGGAAGANTMQNMEKDLRTLKSAIELVAGSNQNLFKSFREFSIEDLMEQWKAGELDLNAILPRDLMSKLGKNWDTTFGGIIEKVIGENIIKFGRETGEMLDGLRGSLISQLGLYGQYGKMLKGLNKYERALVTLKKRGTEESRVAVDILERNIKKTRTKIVVEAINASLIKEQNLRLEKNKKIIEFLSSVAPKRQREELKFRSENYALMNQIAILQEEVAKNPALKLDLALAEKELKLKKQIYDLSLQMAEFDKRRVHLQENLSSSIEAGATSVFDNLANLQKEEEIRWNIKNLEEDILKARKGGDPTADLLNQLKASKDELSKVTFGGILKQGALDFAGTFADAFRTRIIKNLSDDLADIFAKKLTIAQEIEYAFTRGGGKFIQELNAEQIKLVNVLANAPLDTKVMTASAVGSLKFYDQILKGSIDGSAYFRAAVGGDPVPGGGSAIQDFAKQHDPMDFFRTAIRTSTQGGGKVGASSEALAISKGITSDLMSGMFEDRESKEPSVSGEALKGVMSLVGMLGGTAAGGGGAGASMGASIGSMVLGGISMAIPGLGALIGGIGGGLLGGLGDKDWEPPFEDNTKSLNELNTTMQNTNKLLQLSAQLINLPQNFTVPAGARGGFISPGGGDTYNNSFNPNVNVGQGQEQQMAGALFDEYENRYGNQMRRSNIQVSRWR